MQDHDYAHPFSESETDFLKKENFLWLNFVKSISLEKKGQLKFGCDTVLPC